MKALLLSLLLLCSTAVAVADDHVCEGTWKTTGRRKLDGRMICVVTPLDKGQWQGRFYGTWQGTKFDYTVKFSGPVDKLTGTAQIDGANYTWTGQLTPDGQFKGEFDGDRYKGVFDLKKISK